MVMGVLNVKEDTDQRTYFAIANIDDLFVYAIYTKAHQSNKHYQCIWRNRHPMIQHKVNIFLHDVMLC